MTLIFVYGTLKRGGRNHHYLAGQTFVGDACTTAGFRLYNLGGYPGMVADVSSPGCIKGEIWNIDQPCLARLDELEGLRQGLYRREAIGIAPPFASSTVETYLYAQDVAGRPEIERAWLERREVGPG